MAVVFELLPAGADEAAVGTTDYDAVTGDVDYDTAYTFEDLAASVRFRNTDGTIATGEQTLGAPVTTRYFSRVIRPGVFTSGSFTTVLRLRNGGSSLLEVRYNSSGQLILRDGSTTRATHSMGGLGRIVRFELDVTGSTMAFRTYTDPASSVPSSSNSGLAYSGGSFDRILDGLGVAAGWTTAHLLYAADGDSANPSVTRWSASPVEALPEGVRLYVVPAGGTETLTTTEIA